MYLKLEGQPVFAQRLSLLLKPSFRLLRLAFVRRVFRSITFESPNPNQASYLFVWLSIYLLGYLVTHVFIPQILTEHLSYLL